MDNNSSEPLKFAGLPLNIAQPVDVGRLMREVDKLDDDIRQGHLRHKEGSEVKLSPKLKELADYNKVDILDNNQRTQLIHFLEAVKLQAPTLHMSFGSEANDNFIRKLMTWLRAEVSPVALLTVGLEPDIGAGCVVRTNNKSFDFSLRTKLKQSRGLLMEQVKKSTAAVVTSPVVQPVQANTNEVATPNGK